MCRIKFEFMPRKWYHIALTFIYSRWTKGEIRCFVDGCLVEVIHSNWFVFFLFFKFVINMDLY